MKSQGSGISGAVRYVMGEGKRDPETGQVPGLAPGEKSRVAWFGGTGFGFPIDSDQRLDLARRVMEWAAQNQASKTKRCTDDCLHLVLSWDQGERPAREEMEAAARSAMARMGMAGARAIFAAHDDTDLRHLHLVISRINPETGKAFPDRYDTVALSAWALQWEREHGGVRCAARLDTEQRVVERDPEKIIAGFVARRETFTAFDFNRELSKAIPSREARRAMIGQMLARDEFVTLADPATGQVMRYTTRRTLAAEHLAEASAARLAADLSHPVSAPAFGAMLEHLRGQGLTLRPDQLDAVRHATGATALAVIEGKAGTGKSFAMTAIAGAYEADGYTVQALAPSNKVAAALRRDGLAAGTIHSALGSLDRGTTVWNGKTVVMVDEAGMISTRLMARLLSHAEHAGAKVIMLGDDRQLASIDRGGMFGYLAEQHGAGEISRIIRQHGPEQRELAMRASQYDFAAALAALDGQGGIVTVEKPEDRIATAAVLWGAHRAANPDGSLFVVAVSNADAQAANLAIRAIRRGRGELGPDHMLSTADGPQAFAAGDRILFSGSAASREDRAAGMVNGNAGLVEAIEGDRVTIALDGARPGVVISFTVGGNREGGEFDAIRLGYAGTVYKAQGATYDAAIVIDSPSLRASSAYVALTRHREGVTVVTATALQPGLVSWMAGEGGLTALSAAQRASVIKSYDKWRTGATAPAGRRHDLADYVAYVQGKEAARRAERPDQASVVAGMAKRWSRVEDRRAASRFEALDYQAPALGRMTPAEVRASVGAEAFEQDQAVSPVAAPVAPSGSTLVPGRSGLAAGQPADVEKAGMDPQPPLGEDLFNGQAAREAVLLRELQDQEQRAQAFRRARELEAEDARTQAEQKARDEARTAREGDISDAAARHAIALGENYDVRDPYASLARAAMSEYAMFHRGQEKMRADMAAEPDPDKRRVIELRRQIEGCEYMAITNDRLAGISAAIVGRADAEPAVADRQSAVSYREQAAQLRAERSALIETIQERVQVSEAEVTGSNDNAAPARVHAVPLQAAPIQGASSGEAVGAPAIVPPRPVREQESTPQPAVGPVPEMPGAARLAPVTVDPALSRPDAIAAPSESHVTRAKDAAASPPPPAEQQAAMPWLDALRRRVEEAETAKPGKEMSDNALAKLARRLQDGKSHDRDKATEQGKDGSDTGPEPDL